jgi:hypothetical protein
VSPFLAKTRQDPWNDKATSKAEDDDGGVEYFIAVSVMVIVVVIGNNGTICGRVMFVCSFDRFVIDSFHISTVS